MASLVLAYWRSQVQIQNPASVQRWLELVTPRILAEREKGARSAQVFGERLRKLELPGVSDGFKFPDAPALDPAAIRTSLMVTGPVAVRKKVEKAKAFDFSDFPDAETGERSPFRVELPAYVERAAKKEAEKTIAGAALRHTLSGGRAVLQEGAKQDKKAIGWVRQTKADPCYFCAMLASRGLELGGLYDKDSFDESDPRFVGSGTAKVHDNCGCGIKPVYTRQDEILQRTNEFERMWSEFSGGKGDPLLNFRRGYEGRA